MKNPCAPLARAFGFAALTSAVGAASVCAAESKPQQPNIVLIVADDLGWTDLACMGSGFYVTPNIDRLAREGMRFNAAYTCPNCAPTRACLMTGKYTPRHGIYTVASGNRGASKDRKLNAAPNATELPLNMPTIAEMLAKAKSPYLTGIFGKWHLGSTPEYHPLARGFERAVQWVSEGPMHYKYETVPAVPHPENQYFTDFLADQSVGFLRDAKKQNRPFMLMVTHCAVHRPHVAPDEVAAKYKNKPPAGGHRDPVFAAMIEKVDESVGRITAELEALGLAQNTIVIFTSDNGGLAGAGGPTSNAPLRGGKGQFYEGGIRVPYIVRWPGKVKAASSCDTPITVVDFVPTVLELTGIARPQGEPLDGVSVVPLFLGESRTDSPAADRPLYWHCPGYLEKKNGWRSTPGGIIRQGPWKLIELFEDNSVELYNVITDISEKNNVAKEHPEIAAELAKKLRQWRKDLNAPMPTPNPDYMNPAASEFVTSYSKKEKEEAAKTKNSKKTKSKKAH